MVSGAIAYADLKQGNSETLARVIALLKTHPHFETKWVPRLTQLNLSPEEQDLYLFMLAARWPDDIRGDAAQTPPTHPCRQWSLKPTGFFWVKLPLGRPHFSIYDVALYYIM